MSEVVVYYLVDFAEKSEAQWDDVFVPLLQNVLPVIIYIAGGLFSLQAFGDAGKFQNNPQRMAGT